MRMLMLGAACLLVLGVAGAGAATKTVSIGEEGFKSAVVVVAPGTDVTWHNDDKSSHSTIGGFWNSGDLAPGAAYTTRFKNFGEFPYHDGHNPNATGTVVVVAATRPGAARGRAEYRYRVIAALSVHETWEYWDPSWGTRQGPCNAVVGKGSRSVQWTARIPLAVYTRIGGIEVLHTDRPAPTKLTVYRVTQDAKIEGGIAALGQCPDGSQEPAPVFDASCDENLGGKMLKIGVGWSPTASKNKLSFTNDGRDIAPQPDTCGGPSHVGNLTLVDVNNEELPLWLVGNRVLYDDGAAGPLTKAEVQALRSGRSVHIVRALNLDYTTPCCDAVNPRSSQPLGVPGRIGSVMQVRAKLDVRLTRR
jgi:plastocyanin